MRAIFSFLAGVLALTLTAEEILTDADIQAAINRALAEGDGRVRVVPGRYEIYNTIRLPSNLHLVFDNCHLRMADGVTCPMFANRDFANENITVEGVGETVFDGGEPNGLTERSPKKGLAKPTRLQNLMLAMQNATFILSNVSNVTLRGFTIRDQRYWGMRFAYSDYVTVEKIRFELSHKYAFAWPAWPNQDGVHLCVGCHDFVIRDISGETGDDVIALTALAWQHEPSAGNPLIESGRSRDIHDVLIENVRAHANVCAAIRLMAHYRYQLYNVTIRDVECTGEPGEDNFSQCVVKLGDAAYYGNDPANKCQLGDIHDITLENIRGRALTMLCTRSDLRNVTVRNLTLEKNTQSVWCSGRWEPTVGSCIYQPQMREKILGAGLVCRKTEPVVIENMTVDGVKVRSTPTVTPYPPLFRFEQTTFRNCSVKNFDRPPDRPLVESNGCSGSPLAR